jgi:hypothetical protein
MEQQEIISALRSMVVATDFDAPLPEGHPGHEAYLSIVARPRALKVLEQWDKEHGIIPKESVEKHREAL